MKNIIPKPYITITQGMRGFFAVLIWVNEEGFQEPYQTGIGSYASAKEAEPEAKSWADAEGIAFVKPTA